MDEVQVVKADLGNDRVVNVEVRAVGSRETDVGIRDVLSFDGVIDTIEALSETLMGALRTAKPDKATLEFGVDIGVEAGALTALVVKGTGSATVKVTLEWAGAHD